MSEFYSFASESPFLTFFLFGIIGSAIESIANAFNGCKCENKEEVGDEDE